MPNWKDNLKTRKRAPKKIEVVFNVPEGPKGGLGSTFYSGAGPDGIVQPDRIAYRTPQGADIHEDELVTRGFGRDTVVPSPLTPDQPGVQVPRNSEEQMRMARNPQGPGYQFGTRPYEPKTLSDTPFGQRSTLGDYKASTRTAQGTVGPTGPAVSPTIQFGGQTKDVSGMTPYEPGLASRGATNTFQRDNLQRLQEGARGLPLTRAEDTPFEPTFHVPPAAGGMAGGPSGPAGVPETRTAQGQVTPPEQPVTPSLGVPAQPTEQPPTGPEPTGEDLARQQGLAGLSQYAAGRSQVDETIANRALQQFGAAGAEQMGMLQQQYGQLGIEGGRLLAGMASAQQQLGLQEGRLRGELAQGAQERAYEATGQLASAALAGQQFELDKQQYGDTQDWNAYNAAITAGDFGTAADAYERLTGQRLSTDQLKRVQDYQNSVMDYDLQNIELQYGVDTVNAARDMIAKGYTDLNQINQITGMNLTQSQFDAIRDASPLGERDWQRTENLANMMLQSGRPDMIAQAQGMYNDMYPGVDVDFGELITDANANQFAAVSDEMTYYSDKMAWDEVPDRVKENWAETTGMTPDQIESWFGGVKYNMFDEWFGELEGSQEYKDWKAAHPDLATDFEEGIFTMLAADMTEFRTIDAWQVRDGEGKIVGTFESQDAADRFVGANAGKGYIRDAESSGEMIVPQNWLVNGQYVVGGEEFDTTQEPAKESFATFRDEQIPEGYEGLIDQATWESAGGKTLKTWDDFVEAGGIDSIIDSLGENYELMPEDGQALVMKEILRGDDRFISEFTIDDSETDPAKHVGKIYKHPNGKYYVVTRTSVSGNDVRTMGKMVGSDGAVSGDEVPLKLFSSVVEHGEVGITKK